MEFSPKFIISSLFIVLLSVLMNATNATSTDPTCTTSPGTVDFAFLIDCSGSMKTYQEAVANKVASFVSSLQSGGINDYRFAIVKFGGESGVYLNFTSSSDLFKQNIYSLGASCGGQEASLEAMRNTINGVFKSQTLSFRDNAAKNIVVITDEDSDMPVESRNRMDGQAGEAKSGDGGKFEPSWDGIYSGASIISRNNTGVPQLRSSFQTEIDQTAALIVQGGYKVSVVIKGQKNAVLGKTYDRYICSTSDTYANSVAFNKISTTKNCTSDPLKTWTGAWQFGSPFAASQSSDFSNFDYSTTYNNLIAGGLADSLQAKVLSQAGYMRVYDIDNFINNAGTVENFYQAAVDLAKDCVITAVVPGSTTVTKHITSTLSFTTEVSLTVSTVTTVPTVPGLSIVTSTVTPTESVTDTVVVSTSTTDVETFTSTLYFTDVTTAVNEWDEIVTKSTIVETSSITQSYTTTATSHTSSLVVVPTGTLSVTTETTVASTVIPVHTSAVVTDIASATTTAVSTVIATTVSSVTETPAASGSNHTGAIVGGTVAGVAAVGGAAAALFYMNASGSVASAGAFSGTGLSGGNTNPIYDSTAAPGSGTNSNPLYEQGYSGGA